MAAGEHVNDVTAEAILRTDTNTERFERFANEIVTEFEGGTPVLPTSRSWDLGRDGRSETSRTSVYVCSSLADRVDAKSAHDIDRLAAFAIAPYTVFFCSNQSLSEKAMNDIAADLLSKLPKETKVIVLSQMQLAHLASRFPRVFLKFYGVELDDFLATIRSSIEQPVRDDAALRLALVGVAHETSDAIRRGLYRIAVRSALRGKSLNEAECARDVSHGLRLARNLPVEIIAVHLGELEREGEVVNAEDRFELTPKGNDALAEQERNAATQLLAGREKIRERLENEIGTTLADPHFDRIWEVFREKITAAFFDRGQQLVAQVSSILAGKAERDASPDEPLFFVSNLADSVAATSSLPAQQEELKTAVHDIFEEPSGPAFEWLARLCASYVSLCALGLEQLSGKAIARLLAKVALVLDTDITLSLLGEGEPNHDAVVGVVEKWNALGGTLLVGREVLEETARHAVIADYDYEDVRRWIPGTREERLRVIENAFVRAFAELLSRGKIKRDQWPAFIGTYRAPSGGGPALIGQILAQEFGIHQLPPATASERSLEDKARAHLEAKMPSSFGGERLRIAKDKARRDASLYAAIVRQHRTAQQSDPERVCLLVSSAKRLAEVEQRLRSVGEPQLVISLGAALYLLSLVPGVSIGIGAMQMLLFEAHRRISSDLERVLLRIVSESRDVTMAWARRHRLVREVRTRLLADAARSGERRDLKVADVEEEALKESNLQRTAEILRESLAEIVVDQRVERENVDLRATVETLQREVERLRKVRGRRG